MNADEKTPLSPPSRWQAALEIFLVLLLCFLFAGWPPPDVNEAHYLSKARHYWQPAWGVGDIFLESGDAHLVFYWAFGWLTRCLPLTAVAWIGRLITWTGLAWAWWRLSQAVVPRRWFALLTASLFLLFNQRFHLAGEWVVGGVEAKGFAYVLVLFALDAMLRRQWRRVWPLLGIATSFHVLVGGWSFLAGLVAWWSCRALRPAWKSLAPSVVLGMLLALPGLAAALLLNRGADAEQVRLANEIYVYGRLSHHLVFHRFPHEFMARHAVLLAIWLAAAFATPCRLAQGRLGQRPLRGFVGAAVLLAAIGIVIDQSLLYHLDLAAALLKYYWFRLSDVMLPVGAACALAGLAECWRQTRPRWAVTLVVILVLAGGGNLAWTHAQRRLDFRPGADVQTLPGWTDDAARTQRTFEDWQRACRWIAENTPEDALFITPFAQQTFKWYAQRGEAFCWKDVPQDAAAVVEWWQRRQDLYPRRVLHYGLATLGETRLSELAGRYHARYIVVDRQSGGRPLLLPCVYPRYDTEPNPSYAVYRIPGAATGPTPPPDTEHQAPGTTQP